MPSPTPLRPSRTTPPIQQLRRSLKIRRSPANLQLTPLNTAFTPITLLTPLSTVFTYSHPGVGISPRSFPPLDHSWRTTPVFSHSCALLFSLCALFRTRILCFQYLAHSSTKNRGSGYLCALCVSAFHFPVVFFALCFHAFTNCFFRNSRIFTTIPIAPGCHPCPPDSCGPHESSQGILA
jgi:hypothetical protein